MAPSLQMSREERENFLAGVHVGVIGIEDPGRAPLMAPIWYDFTIDRGVWVITGPASRKGVALERAGRDPDELHVVPFGVLPDAGKLSYYAELGVSEAVLRLPGAGRDDVTCFDLQGPFAPSKFGGNCYALNFRYFNVFKH